MGHELRRSDSLFTADEGGHRIDPRGVWRTDNMESAVRRADADPVDTKFGPPSIVRSPPKSNVTVCKAQALKLTSCASR